jgi:hypothetical protein
MVTEMEKFFAQYLGGRYQHDVSPDIASQITLLTVDPKSVSGAVTLNGALAPAK